VIQEFVKPSFRAAVGLEAVTREGHLHAANQISHKTTLIKGAPGGSWRPRWPVLRLLPS
jgi:hypothetical protein